MRENETHLVTRAQLERHVLSNGRSSTIWTGLVPLLLTKLRPSLPFSDGMVDDLFLQRSLDFACDLQPSK